MLVLAVDDLFLFLLFMLVVRSRLLSADTGGGIDIDDGDDGDCVSVAIDVANVGKEDGGEVQ